MHITSFEITKLFKRYDHELRFPEIDTTPPRPGLKIVHGENGIGKTTVLRMIAGMMDMDFDEFRKNPFSKAVLTFSDKSYVTVKWAKKRPALRVQYEDTVCFLDPKGKGPVTPAGQERVDAFRRSFSARTASIQFDLISIERIKELEERERVVSPEEPPHYVTMTRGGKLRRRRVGGHTTALANRVAEFMKAAQGNYRQFFSTEEPDLFPKILSQLHQPLHHDRAEIIKRLERVRESDDRASKVGLATERWNLEKLRPYLIGNTSDKSAVAVLASYTEALESRAAERDLVSSRLLVLEATVNTFFRDKKLRVGLPDGFVIETIEGDRLFENDLSSGERHLLYLLVSAAVSHRRGTAIAIDEPEMSMHLAWQRRLVRSLLACSAGSQPQFILTTHSPEIAADHPECMTEFEPLTTSANASS